MSGCPSLCPASSPMAWAAPAAAGESPGGKVWPMTSAHAEIPQNKQGHPPDSTPVEALTTAVNDSFENTLASLEELVGIPGDCMAKLRSQGTGSKR